METIKISSSKFMIEGFENFGFALKHNCQHEDNDIQNQVSIILDNTNIIDMNKLNMYIVDYLAKQNMLKKNNMEAEISNLNLIFKLLNEDKRIEIIYK